MGQLNIWVQAPDGLLLLHCPTQQLNDSAGWKPPQWAELQAVHLIHLVWKERLEVRMYTDSRK